MLILVGPALVATENPLTVVEFVRAQLGGFAQGLVDNGIWDALADEIWNDPANAHLRHVPRDAAATASQLTLYPGEYVYLPLLPEPAYSLQRIPVHAGESLAAAAMDDARYRGLRIPGGQVTNDELKDLPFNTTWRTAVSTPDSTQVAYYYTVPVVSTAVDAVPTTDGPPQVNMAYATPVWLSGLWHWIDGLHKAIEVLFAAIRDLENINAAATIDIAIAVKIDAFLKVYAQFEPPNTIRIGAFQSKVQAFRTAIESGVTATGAPIPQRKKVEDAWKVVDGMVNDPDWVATYQEFTFVRDRYPATSHALDMATAGWVIGGVHTPSVSDIMSQKVSNTVKSLSPPDSSVTGQQLAATLSAMNSMANTVSPVVTALVGNTPGPSTVTVAALKVHGFYQLMRGAFEDIAEPTNKLMVWVAFANDIRSASVSELGQAFKADPDGARLLAKKLAKFDLWNNAQSGAGLTGVISVLDFVILANMIAAGVPGDEGRKATLKDWAECVAQATGQATTTTGAVAQFLVKVRGAGNSTKLLDSLTSVSFGRIVAAAGIVNALFCVADAWAQKGGDVQHWFDSKWFDATGNMLIALQPYCAVAISRYLPSLATSLGASIARVGLGAAGRAAAVEGSAIAAEVVLGTADVVVGAEAIASMLSFVGGAILVGVFVARNWKAIKELAVPRPGQTCRDWLRGIEASKEFQVFPQSVKQALADCFTAFDASQFASISGTLDGLHDALAKAGMTEDDIASVADMPDAMIGAWGG